MLKYCGSEKKMGKTVKKCSFGIILGQKLGQHELHPKSSSNVFVEIAKGDHKLSRTFILSKYHKF